MEDQVKMLLILLPKVLRNMLLFVKIMDLYQLLSLNVLWTVIIALMYAQRYPKESLLQQ
jgi:hypothetical protein